MNEVERLRHRNKMLEAQVSRLQRLLAEEQAKKVVVREVTDERHRAAAEEHWRRESEERGRQGTYG